MTILVGSKVMTGELVDIQCSCIKEQHMLVRESGLSGTVVGPVFGCCGEVWWVQYDKNAQVGAYDVRELLVR